MRITVASVPCLRSAYISDLYRYTLASSCKCSCGLEHIAVPQAAEEVGAGRMEAVGVEYVEQSLSEPVDG